MSPFAGVSIASRDGRTWERKNPSIFWMLLLLGSVGLHAGSLLLMPFWWRSRQPQSQAANPLPIEVVELAEQPGIGTAASPVAPVAPVVPEAVAPTVEPNPQPQFTQPNVAPLPPQAPTNPQPFATPIPQSEPIPNPAPPITSPPNAGLPPQSPPPQSPPPPQPPTNGTPLPDPVAPPAASPPPQTPDLPPSTDPGVDPNVGDPLAGADPGAGGDSGNQSRNPAGDGDNLGGVGVPGESTPTQFTAELQEVSPLPPEQLQDIPEVYPEPLERAQTVVADPLDARYCQVLPESVEAFGEAVTLRLIIESDGTVQNTIVQSSSGSPDYDELARCIVQNYWTFQPATTEGIPVASDSLTATIVLQR